MKSMLLVLAFAAPAAADDGARGPCPRVECSSECWELRVPYRVPVSPGPPIEYSTVTAVVGGAWGDMAGARCWADHVAREGFWREDSDVPGPGPEKIPASALEAPLRIAERPF